MERQAVCSAIQAIEQNLNVLDFLIEDEQIAGNATDEIQAILDRLKERVGAA